MIKFRKLLFLSIILFSFVLLLITCSDNINSTSENESPTCNITSPFENIVYEVESNILIAVEADDIDGTIDNVVFYFDDNEIHQDETYPFSFQFNTSGYEEGIHNIKVVSKDNLGSLTEDEISINLYIIRKDPVALFTVSRLGDNLFEFDASASYDNEDYPHTLQVRWDIGADGIFDTEWSIDKIFTYDYSDFGTHYVGLEVKDLDDYRDTIVKGFYHPNQIFNPIEMLLMISGDFNMGQVWVQTPIHHVTLTNDFMIGKYEVTNQEYCNMLNYAVEESLIVITTYIENRRGNQKILLNFSNPNSEISFIDNEFIVDDEHALKPVNEVSWYGAAFYCNMLSRQDSLIELYNLNDWTYISYPLSGSGFRLPSEAEWEYTARFDDDRTFAWGETYPNLDLCNYFEYYLRYLTNVGHFSPSGDTQAGVSDMAGNAREWCNDWHEEYSSEDQTNPVGPSTGERKVARGGSFRTTTSYVRAADRNFEVNPLSMGDDIGFRVVKIGE